MERRMREKRPVKKGTFGRLVKYMIGNYPLKSFIVLVCIIFSSTSSVIGSTYLKRLIDEMGHLRQGCRAAALSVHRCLP